jgi:phosphoesterase RecJ-like protein
MVDHATFLADGHAAVCAIPKELEESVSAEDLEGISGFLRSIEGVRISATIRQTETGCKMSVRAVPGYDAAAVCKKFGGGGHKGAAGASLNMTLEEAVKAVTEVMVEVMVGQ